MLEGTVCMQQMAAASSVAWSASPGELIRKLVSARSSRLLSRKTGHVSSITRPHRQSLCRELRAPGSGVAWNASLERSHWQISFREGQALLACQDDLLRSDKESADATAMTSQPPWNAGSALPLKAVSSAETESRACYMAPVTGQTCIMTAGLAGRSLLVCMHCWCVAGA